MNTAKDTELGIKKWLTGPERKTTALEVKPERARDKRRIAVIPLTNMSLDQNDSYFADGITEEMISTLSNIREFTVISRTSMMQYKDAKRSLVEIGKELGAGTMLEGSIRKAGDRVRITVKLLDAVEDKHLWTQSFDRQLQDIFVIQSDIARSIADAVRVELLPAATNRIQKKLTTSTEAYLQYLRGKQEWNKRTVEGARKAIDHFKKALDYDPNFAMANIGLADSYFIMEARGAMTPVEVKEKAKPAISKALQLDDNLAEAHATYARLLEYDFKWDSAESEYRKAIDLNPSYALAHQWYSFLLGIEGRQRAAFIEAEKALELAPLDAVVISNLAHRLIMMERHGEAIEYYERSLALQPDLWSANSGLVIAHASRGDYTSMRASWEKYFKTDMSDASEMVFLASLQALAGKSDEGRNTLSSAMKLEGFKVVSPGVVAWAYAALREEDRTFEWLEKGLGQGDGMVTIINDHIIYKDLRTRPRYRAILKKLNLDKYQ